LDDEELGFLGLPWSIYESSARNMGIDISRVPTPEGLAPPNPASLDEILMDVIRNYTLFGIPVLVHCRGGVGRAGVIACCWLIKLGVCGWFQRRIDKAAHSADDNNQMPRLVVTGSGEHAQEVLQYVGRVIGIVRARRSTKAVETYEQVKFLVEYVEYLSQVR
jgi:protein-tyrosine phosphatase